MEPSESQICGKTEENAKEKDKEEDMEYEIDEIEENYENDDFEEWTKTIILFSNHV